MRNGASYKAKELIPILVIACIGWTVSHFAADAFPARPDITSALAALTIGICSLLWGKWSRGLSYVVAVPVRRSI